MPLRIPMQLAVWSLEAAVRVDDQQRQPQLDVDNNNIMANATKPDSLAAAFLL